MYLKKIVFFACFLWMALSFSMSAYAAPDDDKDVFLETFKISQSGLSANAENRNTGFYTVSTNGESVLEENDDNIRNYRVFVLDDKSGYESYRPSGFSDTKVLSGKGGSDTLVGVFVFKLSDSGDISSSFQSIQKIGVSGVYNGSISLALGDNNVVIAAKKDDSVFYRLFKVTIMEEEKKEKLENIVITFPVNEISPATTFPSMENVSSPLNNLPLRGQAK